MDNDTFIHPSVGGNLNCLHLFHHYKQCCCKNTCAKCFIGLLDKVQTGFEVLSHIETDSVVQSDCTASPFPQQYVT